MEFFTVFLQGDAADLVRQVFLPDRARRARCLSGWVAQAEEQNRSGGAADRRAGMSGENTMIGS